MVVLALGVDERPEGPLGGASSAVHRLTAVDGGLAQHVGQAGPPTGFDESVAPVEDLIAVGHAHDRNRAVDVFARLHRLDRLRGVKPRLRDDDQGVKVGPAEGEASADESAQKLSDGVSPSGKENAQPTKRTRQRSKSRGR